MPHGYPMSPEEESIWLNDQFQAGTSRYLESWAYRLRGARPDPAIVQQVLSAIVARHEALRSRLSMVAGQAWQTVEPPSPVDLDVRRVTPGELPSAMSAAARRPVALDRPPLLRATLLAAATESVLVVAVHHAVIDGWCFSLLDTEFSALYRAALAGTAPALPPLPLQFGPYARDRRHADATDQGDALDYWRETLQAAPQTSSFPADRPRPPALGPSGDQVRFHLDAGLGDGVRRLARAARATPFMVFAAGLTALLSRLSGQEDVVIGTPVSRRSDETLEPMIACLSDIMPLRHRAPTGTPFAGLVASMKEAVWGAMAHHQISYPQLIHELHVERSPSRFPLFQVVLGLDDAPAPALDLPGVTADRLYLHSGTAKYDMFLHLVPAQGGFDGFLEFSTDLFDRRTAHDLTDRLRTLLADAVADPDQPLRDLAVMPPAEQRMILEDWAPGPAAPSDPPLAHELFAAQAARTPDAPAVAHGAQVLSYAEMERRAGALAASLIAAGLSGQPVGVCLPRSPAVAVAVLAILKAGSSCLPLDPAYPPDRIAHMVTDSGAGLILTHAQLKGLLPAGTTTMTLDDVPAAPERALPPVAPADLAYLIYTSGSTGRPKGVAMPHRSLANLLSWQGTRSTAGRGARTLQFAALSFDVAFQEIFSTWATGGTLVMVDENVRRDPAQLLELLVAERINRLFLPFVALQQLAEQACATGRSAYWLREVITAGEQLHATPAVREFFRSHAPGAVLDNQYGPSETHVVTAERLGGDPDAWPELPPIGRPVAGAQVLVLDRWLQPCPPGTAGEIYVGGPVLAAGYLRRPGMTAQKFLPDPFRPGAHLYRTGDLARYLPDGRIQCLGRRDGQVKIRGHRVETGEVAAALQAMPGVAHAAVVARPAAAGGARLLAYYVPAAGAAVEPDTLRRAVAHRLPEYMVPSLLAPVAALPRTASGKVDPAALPAAAEPQKDPGTAPRTATERRIAGIWQELLEVPSVGVHDDFFAAGGHSLLAARLMLRLGEELGVHPALSALAAAPTVAALATLIDGAGDTDRRVDLQAEADLPPDIVAAAETVRVAPRPAHALLTGATGFLGAFLLRSLLDRTGAVVHCLVRGADPEAAAARLRRVMDGYGLGGADLEQRVRVVPGDLALPGLGLADADFDRLAHGVDVVFHAGAAVNLVSSYAQLKAATVGGTAEILRLAARHRSVPVHHVSTVGVFAGDGAGPIGPADPTGPSEALQLGYPQSKWVAEELVDIARSRSLPVTVYRPTRITGHSRTGAGQRGDYLWLLIKGCLQAGAAPAGVSSAFDLVPVDYVSEAIVALSQRPAAAGRTFHLAAGRLTRLDTMFGWLRERGYRLPCIDAGAWLDRIGADPGNAAFPLLGVLASELTGAGSEGGLIFEPSSEVRRAQVGKAMFGSYVDHFVRTDWLPAPS